jgi:hypothetical protein
VTVQPDTTRSHGSGGRSPASPERAEAAPRPSGWGAGRIAAVVTGTLLILVSLGLLVGGGAALWFDRVHRDGGYVTTDVHEFSAPGSALTTEPTQLGSPGAAWLYSPGLLDRIRIRVVPADSGSRLFIGIGPSADVDRYLAGVRHTVVTDFWASHSEPVSGGTPRSAPETQGFWVASTTGPGSRTLVWEPSGGSWTVAVMNADGRPGLDVRADLGARVPSLPWIGGGLLASGAILLAGGVLLITRAIRRRARGAEAA